MRPRGLLHPLSALLLAVILALAAFPAGLYAQSTPPAQPTAAPTPDASRQVRATARAFDLLMDRYVYPLDSAPLLAAGWAQLQAEAAEQGAPDPGPMPDLTGDRGTDLTRVRLALTRYLLAHEGSLPAGWVPGHAVSRGLAAFVHEGHTQFLSPRQYSEHLAWLQGDVHYAGIGARMRGPRLTITEVFPDSPAEKAGLRAGDVILAVDGTSIEGKPLDETVLLIRGAAGTQVQLLIERPGQPAPRTVVVVRAEVSAPVVISRLLDSGVGYVALRSFPEPSAMERFEASVRDLRDAGATGLVLDLRGNSGGRIDLGTQLLGHFLPEGTPVWQQVNRAGTSWVGKTPEAEPFDLPLVVLVDGGTASMGEIFSAALQEAGVAPVLGTVTSGNVAAANVLPLGDGSALEITVSEVRTGQGTVLNGVGVQPDEEIEPTREDLAAGRDPVLNRAVVLLQERAEALTRLPITSQRPLAA